MSSFGRLKGSYFDGIIFRTYLVGYEILTPHLAYVQWLDSSLLQFCFLIGQIGETSESVEFNEFQSAIKSLDGIDGHELFSRQGCQG